MAGFSEEMNVYKVVFCGSSNMGKTKMIKQMTQIEDDPLNVTHSLWDSFASTLGVQVTPYVFSIGNKFFKFNVWDCGSTHRGMGKVYFKGCDVAFIFTRKNEESVRKMYEDELHEMAPNVVIYHVDETDTINDINYGLVLFASN